MKSLLNLNLFFLLFSTTLGNQFPSQTIAPENYSVAALRIKNHSIRLDGVLNETAWQIADSITQLIQSEPDLGTPATEKTVVKILYDAHNIYVGAVCYYQNIKDLIATKLAHRDIAYDDHIGFVLDTFHDRTKGYSFITNAYGAKEELFIDGVDRSNPDWDEVWQVKTKINRNNWTAEFKIPLRILRFPDSDNQIWGFNIYRALRKKNERDCWVPIPPQHTMTNLSLAGKLTGLDRVNLKRNLQVKPYLLLGETEDTNSNINSVDKKSEWGFDAKYVPLPNLAIDLTYNTDFAQIESDEEQINLSRFSLFYFEKRDFFLENAQLFQFGLPQKIQPFFSRGIGIHNGKSVPILYGARFTGKYGKGNLGFLNITTKKTAFLPLTNYSVLRIRRDILKNSNVGFIFTNVQSKEGFNRCWGIDYEIWLSENARIRGFYSSVDSKEINSKRTAANLGYSLNRDLYQFSIGYVSIERNYNPATGFVIINDIKDYSGILRKSFRPNKYGLRKLNFIGIFDYTYTRQNKDSMRQNILMFSTEFDSVDKVSLKFYNIYEKLYEDYNIYKNIFIPAGEYHYNNPRIQLTLNRRRNVSGSVSYLMRSIYDGSLKSFTLDGSIKLNRHLIVSEGFEYNNIHLTYGNFTTTIGRLRIDLIFTSNFFLKTYFQYNSATKKINSNIRLHLLHGLDNDLYIVHNDLSSTEYHRLKGEMNTVAVKLDYRFYL